MSAQWVFPVKVNGCEWKIAVFTYMNACSEFHSGTFRLYLLNMAANLVFAGSGRTMTSSGESE